VDERVGRELRDAILESRVCSVAVDAEGSRCAELLFAVRSDLTCLLVHASDLARHTRGLTPCR